MSGLTRETRFHPVPQHSFDVGAALGMCALSAHTSDPVHALDQAARIPGTHPGRFAIHMRISGPNFTMIFSDEELRDMVEATLRNETTKYPPSLRHSAELVESTLEELWQAREDIIKTDRHTGHSERMITVYIPVVRGAGRSRL